MKKLLTPLLFFYLGGFSLAFTICLAFDNNVPEAAGQAAMWPAFVWFMFFGGVA
jgi:hypothetical protein